MEKITQEQLKALLHYDPETGIFIRIKSGRGRNNRVGSMAGNIRTDGAIQIRINNEVYLAHRLAFLYMLGDIPFGHIKHNNGIKSDNRWCNLRKTNRHFQGWTNSASYTAKTGRVGIFYNAKSDFYFVQFTINNEPHYIGSYKTFDEAIEARDTHPLWEQRQPK